MSFMSLTNVSKWIGMVAIAVASYQLYVNHYQYQSCQSLLTSKSSIPNTKQRKKRKLQKLIEAFIRKISTKPAYVDIIQVIFSSVTQYII